MVATIYLKIIPSEKSRILNQIDQVTKTKNVNAITLPRIGNYDVVQIITLQGFSQLESYIDDLNNIPSIIDLKYSAATQTETALVLSENICLEHLKGELRKWIQLMRKF